MGHYFLYIEYTQSVGHTVYTVCDNQNGRHRPENAPVIEKEGGLTFAHTAQGDIELQEVGGGSSIPARYPLMSDTTVDWSLIHRRRARKLAGKEGLTGAR